MKAKQANVQSCGVTSSTARRILQSLEKMSSPLAVNGTSFNLFYFVCLKNIVNVLVQDEDLPYIVSSLIYFTVFQQDAKRIPSSSPLSSVS